MVTKLIFTIKTVEWGPCHRKYVEGSILLRFMLTSVGFVPFAANLFIFIILLTLWRACSLMAFAWSPVAY